MSMLRQRKRCYWRVNYVSDGHLKRHDEFVQSVKSSNAVEKLQNMIKVTATVIRDKKQMEILLRKLCVAT